MSFQSQIKAFNKMYGMPVSEKPGIPTDVFPTADDLMDRLAKFKHILAEELEEVDELINHINEGANEVEILTELADWLGDIQVYCASEMVKFGLDNALVLEIIMRSNRSKLGADGKPIYDERGKVMKGPGYWKPEPMIAHYISEAINGEQP